MASRSNSLILGLKVDIGVASGQLSEYLAALNSARRLAQKMGLPEDMQAQGVFIGQTIRLVYQLEAAYRMLALAEASTGNPIAIIRAAAAIGAATVSAIDLVVSR